MLASLSFRRLASFPPDGLPYPVFYYRALVPWTYFSYALQMTTTSSSTISASLPRFIFRVSFFPFPPRFPAWWTSPSVCRPRHFHRPLTASAPTLAALCCARSSGFSPSSPL